MEELNTPQKNPNNTQPEESDRESDIDFLSGQTKQFTQIIAEATRKGHKRTDMLVNAKLGFAMSDDRIWAEGILIFYEIFKFLESSLQRHSERIEIFSRMNQILNGIERTAAFESDIKYYYGQDFFDSYKPRPSVQAYLKHLQFLDEREPLRLIAYVYHLYLGLLSGGQILKKKRAFKNKIATVGGLLKQDSHKSQDRDKVVQLEVDGRSISDIKKEIKYVMNEIASDLSKDERNSLISESILVFKHNLNIISSIDNTGKVAVKVILTHPFFILLVILIGMLIWYLVNTFS